MIELFRKCEVSPQEGLKLTTLNVELSHCTGVGTTRRGELKLGDEGYALDMHYNLYKKSLKGFEGQRQNLLNLMKYYGAERFVSTALFHATSNVVYVNKNGLRILGPGKGKRACLMQNYDPFDRELQLHADGIICEPGCGIVPVTYSADCVTGVMCAPNGAYGVFHAMAKKLMDYDDNVITSMIFAFNKLYGFFSEELELAFYPSVHREVYEVDEAFAEKFGSKYVIKRSDGEKPCLDIEEMAVDIALRRGVLKIFTTGRTTATQEFESMRGAEKAILATGLMGSGNAQNFVFALPTE